jgi:Papain-like cysteine protease AvrRpt2
MRKILGICMTLCLGFVWGCAEVEVLIPSHALPPPPDGTLRPPITLTLDELKQMQTQNGKPVCNPNGFTQDVPREKQQTPAWCWAASTRMVMEYHNEKQQQPTDPQCKIVSKIFGISSERAGCCETKITSDFIDAPLRCVQGGWPNKVFDYYQYSYQTVGGALDWEALTREICTTGPFISVIDWNGGGKHAFITKGYSTVALNTRTNRPSPLQIVIAYDPFDPTGKKDIQYQTFDEFVGDSTGRPNKSHGFSHDLNFVQIKLNIAKDYP